MGQCFGTNCAKLDKDDRVDGIGKANQLPGVTGCVGWKEGCTFYRFFATPINNNIVKIQHCNNWKTTVRLNVTLIGQKKLKENHLILLEEGETVNTNQISYSLLNVNQNSIMADVVLIDNGKTAAVVDQFGIAASQILKCPTAEDAIAFSNSSCSLKFESCRCRPADGIVHCDCRDNTVLQQYFSEMMLPRKLGNNFLQRDGDKFIVTSNSRLQLKVGLQRLKLSTVVDRNKCKATVQSLNGCINCMAGAMLNISCLTDFGTAEGHVSCPSASFSIKCTTTSYQQTINLQFADVVVKETCELQCPGERSKFELAATLWRARDTSNDWKMADDHVTATPSFIA
uniref:Phlebovirus glycoprotein G2 fusion domain-containing protein n=1 Tax=Panagrolaimus sp. ES5 TaxID=591445 RepID=A0AC34GD63_9BILA